jgi:hypothetical protein
MVFWWETEGEGLKNGQDVSLSDGVGVFRTSSVLVPLTRIDTITVVTRTGNVARPHRAVVSDVRPDALAIVRVPKRGVVVLGAREQQIALAVVLDERQRPLVAFQENRPHVGARALDANTGEGGVGARGKTDVRAADPPFQPPTLIFRRRLPPINSSIEPLRDFRSVCMGKQSHQSCSPVFLHIVQEKTRFPHQWKRALPFREQVPMMSA